MSSSIRSARIRSAFSKMESDNSGGNGQENVQPDPKRRRLINGVPRTGPRTRGKIENETLMLMEDRLKEEQELLEKRLAGIDSTEDNAIDPSMVPFLGLHHVRLDDSCSSSASSVSPSSSDSEDTSDMDEEATEKERTDLQAEMSELEKQFQYLRELLYRERITHVHQTIEEVRAGKARAYLGPLEALQDNMRERIEVASILRDYRSKSLNIKDDAEKLAILQNLESERLLIYDAIKSDLEDKIHRLELDRNNDFTTDYWYESVLKKKNKKSLDIFGEKKKKAITVSGPYIVYMLSDVDIVEDWTVLKKALTATAPKRKFNGESILAY